VKPSLIWLAERTKFPASPKECYRRHRALLTIGDGAGRIRCKSDSVKAGFEARWHKFYTSLIPRATHTNFQVYLIGSSLTGAQQGRVSGSRRACPTRDEQLPCFARLTISSLGITRQAPLQIKPASVWIPNLQQNLVSLSDPYAQVPLTSFISHSLAHSSVSCSNDRTTLSILHLATEKCQACHARPTWHLPKAGSRLSEFRTTPFM